MKKRILSILLTLCMVICLVPTGVFAEGAVLPENVDITGSGTQDDPYLIYTAEGLKAFRDKANGGERMAFATLMDDIILNDGTFDADGKYTAADGGTSEPEKWTPIGTYDYKYSGTFDGNGKTIKGLYVNIESDEPAGLFGSTSSPKIKNLTVDGSVTGKRYVGGILGFSSGGGNIENCTNNAFVTAADFDNDPYTYAFVGGIAGCSTSKLIGCSNTGKITVKNVAQGVNVGGVVGYQMSGGVPSTYDCYNTGEVSGEAGILYLGGVAGGIINGSMSDCYSVGRLDTTGSTTVYLGGIIGMNNWFYDHTNIYYLEGTAEKAAGRDDMEAIDESILRTVTKEGVRNGTLLGMLIGEREDGEHPWSGACGYIESADMVLPILKWQIDIYGHSHCICSGSTDAGDHTAHTDIDWTPWASTDSLPDKAGSYYLMNDVTLTYDLDRGGYWRAKDNINICLNGKTISSNGPALIIDSSAILSVTDCGGSGRIIGGTVYIDRWSTTNIISAVICERGSVFNLYGGAILMNEDGKDGRNEIVAMYAGAVFNMYGGSIGDSSYIGTEDEGRYLHATSGDRFNAYGGAIYGPVYFGFRSKIYFGNTAFATNIRHRRDYSTDFLGTVPTNFIGDACMVWEYPLHILVGDTRIRIDDLNRNDILGDGSGSLKYEFDESSQIGDDGNLNDSLGHGTLTFNNAKLVYAAGGNCDVINFGREFTLDIVLIGKNAIVPDKGEAKGGSVIAGTRQLTIKGDGSLDIISKRDQCIGITYGVTLGDEDIKILTSTNSDGTGAVTTDVGDGGALGAAKYMRIGADHTHCICGKNTDSSHNHTDVIWTPWASADSLPSAAGNYYLVDDVTLPAGDIALPDGVNICLNGNSICSTDADNTKLNIGGTVHITDCGTTGSIGDITEESGKLIMWGGEIRSGIFYGEVENNGRITGGIFYGRVSGSGIIADSAKRRVSFDSNGGSKVDEIKVLRGQTAAVPAIPEKLGHKFLFWLNGGVQYSFTDPVLENLNLTAKWRDIEKPTGEIKISENSWKTFLNNITFGLFFKDTQTVTIAAADNSGEAVTVEYLLSAKELTKAELDGMTFTAYTAPFGIDPDNKYIIYVRLTDKAGNTDYICSEGIVLDGTNPVIKGIENGKTYCEAQTVTIDEMYVDTVTVNGTAVTLDENNSFVLAPADGEQKIIVKDKAGNTAEMTVTVNDGHTFGEWASNGDGTHTRKCAIDGCNDSETKDCSGGKATCAEKAVCEVCGKAYGETDTNTHEDLTHVEAKAATKDAEGNIEYWYCEDCGKYYSDADATKEITKATTVTAKLPDDSKSPQTGDHSNLMLWIALLFISGGVAIGITVIGKKKKRSAK